ncbi:similar to Saccharomyces cerevisiae YOL088C MPD2 Member of the protein disulfide isomerase (PDI) family, exhibits chaperone activity [Maudiozyma saulgeensis]|uniref:Similar to Saccharomyces cerevisiae YOL088C MPD2 Member of the protein disulfide isomerase (PDI) family, exhibits chaperone activity n=1 Tax=Maudiozyma saulgeensis TaxID=1789683 RepID=A0A1X7R8C8_9SACH|nr:similar to Saccharomyces cerevisiae YOL088C MPD2 Member of the protein disulfide isomerase (PDI) family, exhibits chaperone activity [Kazachstania saulgeensis]
MLLIYWLFLFFGQTFAHSTQTNTNQKDNDEHVTYIMDTNQFYNFTNIPNSYTVVKFYTTWCSHCKTLKPVFQDVASKFHSEVSPPKVNFIEVNCEVFGNNLCSSLPGFPIIHVIKPSDDTINANDNTENQNDILKNESVWNRLLNKIWTTKASPNTFIEPARIVQFQGRRDASTIENFIRTIITKDNELAIIKTVLDPSADCDAMNELCLLGKNYLEELQKNKILKKTLQGYELVSSSNIDAERSKLSNILRNINLDADSNDDAETISKVKNLKFLSALLNHLEDSMVNQTRDEL